MFAATKLRRFLRCGHEQGSDEHYYTLNIAPCTSGLANNTIFPSPVGQSALLAALRGTVYPDPTLRLKGHQSGALLSTSSMTGALES